MPPVFPQQPHPLTVQNTAGQFPRVDSDDLELEIDPALLGMINTDPAHVPDPQPAPVQASIASDQVNAKPWDNDPNYITLCDMRDTMREIAKAVSPQGVKLRVDPKDRINAAKVALVAADKLISWFGVEKGDVTDAAQQAAIAAGQEASRRAVNQDLFNATNPVPPAPWASQPGDHDPHRIDPEPEHGPDEL